MEVIAASKWARPELRGSDSALWIATVVLASLFVATVLIPLT